MTIFKHIYCAYTLALLNITALEAHSAPKINNFEIFILLVIHNVLWFQVSSSEQDYRCMMRLACMALTAETI